MHRNGLSASLGHQEGTWGRIKMPFARAACQLQSVPQADHCHTPPLPRAGVPAAWASAASCVLDLCPSQS